MILPTQLRRDNEHQVSVDEAKFDQTMGDLPAGSVGNQNLGQVRRNKLRELLAIPGLWSQLYAAMALSVAAFVAGIVEGWPGSMSLKLTEPETAELFDPNHNTSHPSNNIEKKDIRISHIYFWMLLSALIHMLVTGALMDRFGRKAGCWFLNVLAPSGWAFLATAGSLGQLYLGAALIGSVAVSGESVGVVYISEISNDRIRGPLISLLMFFNSLGILAAHVLGEELNFYVFHYICLVVTLSFPFFFWVLPESPQYLMLKSRLNEAKDSVAWYHGNDPIIIDLEIKKLENAKKFDLGECKTLLGSLSNRKAIAIVLGLSALTELVGTSVTEVSAGSTLAQIHNGQLSTKIASMILASCRFFGGVLNVYFVERSGRRPTLRASLLKMGLWLILLFMCFQRAGNNSGTQGLPAPHGDLYTLIFATICLVLYTLANQMFLGTAEVLSGEVLSAETKGAMFAFRGFVRIVTLIICVLLYDITLTGDIFGTWHVLFNSVCCFLGAYLTHRFIPETQGKTLNEIHKELEVDSYLEQCD